MTDNREDAIINEGIYRENHKEERRQEHDSRLYEGGGVNQFRNYMERYLERIKPRKE
jgi:hypothetical protein